MLGKVLEDVFFHTGGQRVERHTSGKWAIQTHTHTHTHRRERVAPAGCGGSPGDHWVQGQGAISPEHSRMGPQGGGFSKVPRSMENLARGNILGEMSHLVRMWGLSQP